METQNMKKLLLTILCTSVLFTGCSRNSRSKSVSFQMVGAVMSNVDYLNCSKSVICFNDSSSLFQTLEDYLLMSPMAERLETDDLDWRSNTWYYLTNGRIKAFNQTSTDTGSVIKGYFVFQRGSNDTLFLYSSRGSLLFAEQEDEYESQNSPVPKELRSEVSLDQWEELIRKRTSECFDTLFGYSR